MVSFSVVVYFLSPGNRDAEAIPQIVQDCLDQQACVTAFIYCEVSDLIIASQSLLLCLNCKERGHLIEMFPEDWSSDEVRWFLSDMRETMRFDDNSRSSHFFCNRCKELDLRDWLRQDNITGGDIDWTRRTLGLNDRQRSRKLGRVGSIVLQNDCSLCRCLFGLTTSPMSCDQEVILVLNWS